MSQDFKKFLADQWDKWNVFEENSHTCSLDLTEGNPLKVFQSSRKKNPFLTVYFPDPKGDLELRIKIAKKYIDKGFSLDEEDVLITTGTSESLLFILKTICNPSDEVLIPAPGYPLFDFLLDQEKVNYKYYSYIENIISDKIKWSIDLSSLEAQISPNTKVMVLVNPNNPLGVLLSEIEKKQLESVLRFHQIILIVDEVFIDYSLTQINEKDISKNFFNLNYFLLNGASKSYGQPGLKIGWIVTLGQKEFKKSVNPILEIISDTFLNVSTPSQILFKSSLKKKNKNHEKISKRIQKNYKFIKNITRNSGYLKPIEIEYGWYLPLKIKLGISEPVLLNDLMQEKSLKVYAGSLFHFHDNKYMIVSLLVRQKVIKKAFKKINSYFSHFSKDI
jgi:alanine-synthesizing transaminase